MQKSNFVTDMTSVTIVPNFRGQQQTDASFQREQFYFKVYLAVQYVR